MKMSLKQKMISAISAHPILVTLGIGLAITAVLGIGLGAVDNSHQAFATGHTDVVIGPT